MNNVSEYAIPTSWTAIVLVVATTICVVVNIVFTKCNEKELAYMEKGLVRVTMRYPSTFTDKDIWVKSEDVDKYTRMNLGLIEAYTEISETVSDTINK